MFADNITNACHFGNSLVKYNLAFAKALKKETEEFANSALIAAEIALKASRENKLDSQEVFDVITHNGYLMAKGTVASLEKLSDYSLDIAQQSFSAFYNTVTNGSGEKLHEFMIREAECMERVANFHEQIDEIEGEFGFDFESRGYNLVHETKAFNLYQVLPNNGTHVNDYKKPVLLVPPYMLGVHILSFLPNENKSYAHAFANEGIPTYVRVVKNITTEEDVQKLTPEEDCLQTMELCAVIKDRHENQKVTLNGTCQGGYICLMNILSGHLVDVVDSLITNMAPIDGTYSRAIKGMPHLHSDFITRKLDSGARVADGDILSFGMRFVAIDQEMPLVKVLNAAAMQKATDGNPGKTVAALFRWLSHERVHLPLAISTMSTTTFQQPISPEGILPVKLFGDELNIKNLEKMGVKWYQGYAKRDDLVPVACATAANRFLDEKTLEAVEFPGGHVSILTSPHSWKSPINGHFGDKRGPVAWLLEFENKS